MLQGPQASSIGERPPATRSPRSRASFTMLGDDLAHGFCAGHCLFAARLGGVLPHRLGVHVLGELGVFRMASGEIQIADGDGEHALPGCPHASRAPAGRDPRRTPCGGWPGPATGPPWKRNAGTGCRWRSRTPRQYAPSEGSETPPCAPGTRRRGGSAPRAPQTPSVCVPWYPSLRARGRFMTRGRIMNQDSESRARFRSILWTSTRLDRRRDGHWPRCL
jgi:hypothetical protein